MRLLDEVGKTFHLGKFLVFDFRLCFLQTVQKFALVNFVRRNDLFQKILQRLIRRNNFQQLFLRYLQRDVVHNSFNYATEFIFDKYKFSYKHFARIQNISYIDACFIESNISLLPQTSLSQSSPICVNAHFAPDVFAVTKFIYAH